MKIPHRDYWREQHSATLTTELNNARMLFLNPELRPKYKGVARIGLDVSFKDTLRQMIWDILAVQHEQATASIRKGRVAKGEKKIRAGDPVYFDKRGEVRRAR